MTITLYVHQLNRFAVTLLKRLREIPSAEVVAIHRTDELIDWWR